ncbi:MAG: OmpA family protein [candidate division Zixibacteria bacterium]|nr:OmpA family protein [candidate division Zixibacteria bacterium]
MMKRFCWIVVALTVVMLAGCGASKDYVAQQIEESGKRTSAQLAELQSRSDTNAEEIARLRVMTEELDLKADMALNEAEGFEDYKIIWTGEIYFAFNSRDLTPASEEILSECGSIMESNPTSLLEIAGHTDHTGPADYNLKLGQQRADEAKRFLTDKSGIPLYRLFTVSYGEELLASLPDDLKANSKERRVALTVWSER